MIYSGAASQTSVKSQIDTNKETEDQNKTEEGMEKG